MINILSKNGKKLVKARNIFKLSNRKKKSKEVKNSKMSETKTLPSSGSKKAPVDYSKTKVNTPEDFANKLFFEYSDKETNTITPKGMETICDNIGLNLYKNVKLFGPSIDGSPSVFIYL